MRKAVRMPRASADGRTWMLSTFCGAAGFWLANFGISLTPVAADYRASVGIAYLPMVIEALAGGVVIAAGVSTTMPWAQARWPRHSPMAVSLWLSVIALIAVTALIEAPAKLPDATGQPWHDLLVATAFNVVRIPALGVAIGSVARRPAPVNRGPDRSDPEPHRDTSRKVRPWPPIAAGCRKASSAQSSTPPAPHTAARPGSTGACSRSPRSSAGSA